MIDEIERGAKAAFLYVAPVDSGKIDELWSILPDDAPDRNYDDEITATNWPEDIRWIVYVTDYGRDYYRGLARAVLGLSAEPVEVGASNKGDHEPDGP